MRINEYDVCTARQTRSVYLIRKTTARAMRLHRIAYKTPNNLLVTVGDYVDDVAKTCEPRSLFHTQAHRVLGHAHHRLGHPLRSFPLVALLHFATCHTRKDYLRAARKTLYTWRHVVTYPMTDARIL